MTQTVELTSVQWEKINGLVKSMATDYANGFDEDVFNKGEIHKQEDRYEQREYASSYYSLESEIEDVIRGAVNDEELNKYNVEGFHDLVIDFENWLSDELPNSWYVYFEDGDIWVARHWDNIEDIPEDLQNLVNE